MEKNFNTDNFEHMLREATDDFRMYPSRRVWHGIYNDLHPAKKWPSFAVLLLLVTSIMYIGVANPDKGGRSIAQVSMDAKDQPIQPESLNIVSASSANSSRLTATPTLTSDEVSPSNVAKNAATPSGSSNLYVASIRNTDPINRKTELKNNTELFVKRGGASSNSKEQLVNPVFTSTEVAATGVDNNKSVVTEVFSESPSITLSSPLLNNETKKVVSNTSAVAMTPSSISKPVVTSTRTASTVISPATLSAADESGWMEDYAFRNLKLGDKWKGRMSYQIYVTPSLGYRTLSKNREYSLPPTNALITNPYAPSTVSYTLNHSSAINLELGTGVVYSLSKLIRLKAGVQFNYTNYSVNAQELSHPTFSALMLTNTFTNAPVLSTRTTNIANTAGPAARYLNNNTYQVSIPVGADVKVAGKDKLKVYVGGTLQPTYIFGGQAYLVSADMKNYVEDGGFIRKHNLNGAVEAFVTYKTKTGVTLNAGPQFRYQFFSTYNNMYTYDEKLYNVGVKLGMTKNF